MKPPPAACVRARRFNYLLRATPSAVLCSVAAGVYLTFKGGALLASARMLAAAAGQLLRQGAPYGTYVGKDELMEAGGVGGACPICQVSAAWAGARCRPA
jgi:hypothetical protein